MTEGKRRTATAPGAAEPASMAAGALRIALYATIAVGPLLLLALTTRTRYGLTAETGRSAALVGFMIILLQPLVAGRYRWVSRPFGFDIVIRFHKHMAILALGLVIAHPVLLAAGSDRFDLLYSLRQPWYILAGKVALVLLVLTAALSMFGVPERLKFERWRFLHDLLAPVLIILAFVHAWIIGGDLRIPWMRTLWIGGTAISLSAYLYHRFLRPLILSRSPYRVTAVDKVADRVWNVTLAPPEGRRVYDYMPGQFQFITFHRGRRLPEEEHHWTISSSPADQTSVSSTIKELGDFTSTIGETAPGDTATVHAPFGRFSYVLHPDELDLVFVAGGIGITPQMAMIRHMRDTASNMPVLLIYANRDRESIAFAEELEEIARGGHPRLRIVHVLSKPPDGWKGERGRIDADMLERLCGGRFADRGFYICGPPGLLAASVGALEGFGVPHRRIHEEIFSLLD